MEQLLFHGKKTVPAALRRDMWTPYFSLHFPPTIHGAEAGMLAYRRLRELSLQRQLSPPREMVEATQTDVDDKKAKVDPFTWKDRLERRLIKGMPTVGERLPKRLLAKRLMDQKATSVADVRLVTELYLEGQNPTEMRKARLRKFKSRLAQMGRRAKLRLQKIRQLEARKRDLIRLLATEAKSAHHAAGHLTLTRHAANRISAEYLGYSRVSGGLKSLHQITAAKEGKATEAELRKSMADVQTQIDSLLSGQSLPQTENVEHARTRVGSEADEDVPAEETLPQTENTEHARTKASSEADEDVSAEETSEEQDLMVKIMWADLRDSTYASEDWPQGVVHGSLERIALSKLQTREGTRYSRSVHVIGGEQDSLWARDPEHVLEYRRQKEAIYKRGQEAAQSLEGKMQQAVQILRNGSLEESDEFDFTELTEELQRNEKSMDPEVAREERELESTALEHDWWALEPQDREGIPRDHAILLAQVLKRRGSQQVAEENPRAVAPSGIVINAPKAGWFARLRAWFNR